MARKEKATREEILKNQEIIKNEPEFLDDVKNWSYILDEKKQEKKQEKKHYKKRK